MQNDSRRPYLGDAPDYGYTAMRPSVRHARRAKRILDVFATCVALILLGVPMLVIALVILATMGPPAFFKQQRPGLRGRPFVLYKFRTMRHATDGQGRLLPDTERLTGLGRWLRATSLDELPEFWNVLKGDMSLVGPRPLLMEYLDRYTPAQARRHDVKPGITGWAQINGRNLLTWEEKFQHDVWYVDHWSLVLDVRILCVTILKVLRRDGISAEGAATMPPFVAAGSDAREQDGL